MERNKEKQERSAGSPVVTWTGRNQFTLTWGRLGSQGGGSLEFLLA